MFPILVACAFALGSQGARAQWACPRPGPDTGRAVVAQPGPGQPCPPHTSPFPSSRCWRHAIELLEMSRSVPVWVLVLNPQPPQCAGACDSTRGHRVGVSGGWRLEARGLERRTSLPSSRTPSQLLVRSRFFTFYQRDLRWSCRGASKTARTGTAQTRASYGAVASHSYRWNEPVTPAL